MIQLDNMDHLILTMTYQRKSYHTTRSQAIIKTWYKNSVENHLKSKELRVVHAKTILFLKSMSERVGFDIERLWIWMTSSSIDFESI